MAYTIKHVQPLLGKYVHVRLHVGREYRGHLIEVDEKEGALKLSSNGLKNTIPLYMVSDIFWSPAEEKEYGKIKVIS